MEKNKRCENCGRHPFCEYYNKCIYGNGNEEHWIKREVQMHLKSKKGEKFDFERLK